MIKIWLTGTTNRPGAGSRIETFCAPALGFIISNGFFLSNHILTLNNLFLFKVMETALQHLIRAKKRRREIKCFNQITPLIVWLSQTQGKSYAAAAIEQCVTSVSLIEGNTFPFLI